MRTSVTLWLMVLWFLHLACSVHADRRLRPRDPKSTPLRLAYSGPDTITCLAASRDGKWLATGGHAGKITVWAANDGRIAHELQCLPYRFSARIISIALDPTGRYLASVNLVHPEPDEFFKRKDNQRSHDVPLEENQTELRPLGSPERRTVETLVAPGSPNPDGRVLFGRHTNAHRRFRRPSLGQRLRGRTSALSLNASRRLDHVAGVVIRWISSGCRQHRRRCPDLWVAPWQTRRPA